MPQIAGARYPRALCNYVPGSNVAAGFVPQGSRPTTVRQTRPVGRYEILVEPVEGNVTDSPSIQLTQQLEGKKIVLGLKPVPAIGMELSEKGPLFFDRKGRQLANKEPVYLVFDNDTLDTEKLSILAGSLGNAEETHGFYYLLTSVAYGKEWPVIEIGNANELEDISMLKRGGTKLFFIVSTDRAFDILIQLALLLGDYAVLRPLPEMRLADLDHTHEILRDDLYIRSIYQVNGKEIRIRTIRNNKNERKKSGHAYQTRISRAGENELLYVAGYVAKNDAENCHWELIEGIKNRGIPFIEELCNRRL